MDRGGAIAGAEFGAGSRFSGGLDDAWLKRRPKNVDLDSGVLVADMSSVEVTLSELTAWAGGGGVGALGEVCSVLESAPLFLCTEAFLGGDFFLRDLLLLN